METLATDLDNNRILWDEIGAEGCAASRLLGTLTMAGVHFHMEAIEMKPDGYEAATDEGVGVLEKLQALDPEAEFSRIEIGNKPYVVFMLPPDR